MKIKRLPLFSGLVLILLYIIFSETVRSQALTVFDFQATIILQRFIPKSLDTTLSIFSILGSFEILTAILIFVLLLRKKLNGLAIFSLYSIGMLTETLGKVLVFHPGPPHRFFRYDLDFLFPSSFIQTKFSYRSGHAMRSSFLILFFIFLLIKSKRISSIKKLSLILLLLILLIIMVVSRVSLGEHWSTDVVAGMLLGISLGFLATVFSYEKSTN